MPRNDGTGPNGMGPIGGTCVGRGANRVASGKGAGRGTGRRGGRGMGRRNFSIQAQEETVLSTQDKLENERAALAARMAEIDKMTEA